MINGEDTREFIFPLDNKEKVDAIYYAEFDAGKIFDNGNQWLSWIHIKDLTSMIRFIIEHPELNGPINATAPESVRMRGFYKVLGEVLHRPFWLPVPELLLKIALG